MTIHLPGGLRWSSLFLVAVVVLCGVAACKGLGALGELGQTVQSIQITPANPEVATGKSLRMTATATYSNNTQLDVTDSASWSSSNSTVATAGSAGQVVAVATGITTITATLSGVSGTTQLTVTTSGAGVPAGYAYVASADAQGQQVPGAVFQYTIGSDGSLTPMSVASVPAGVNPTAMVSDPSGSYVYVANLGDATISQYAVSTGGGLTALTPKVVSIAGPFPSVGGYSLSVDPNGTFLYVVTTPRDPSGSGASIAQFSIGSDGTLAPFAEPFINTAASAAGPLTIDPSGQYAYLAGGTTAAGGGEVSQFSVGSDGTLVPLAPATVVASQTPVGIAIAPSGQTAYVLSSCVDKACDGQVAQFTIGAAGALTSTDTTITTGSHINPVAMVTSGSPSSAYLLVNSMGTDTNSGLVYQYTIDSTGGLVPETPNSLSVTSGAVAESTYGSNLYALSANAVGVTSGAQSGGHIDHYTIQSDGLLTAVGTTSVAASLPTAMTLVVAH
jgi:6-phosphogluconolactonase (cycloisomerase 2 family)